MVVVEVILFFEIEICLGSSEIKFLFRRVRISFGL
jgi:hypothetical protein